MKLKYLAAAGAAAMILGTGAPPASAAVFCEKVDPCVNVKNVSVTEGNGGTRQAVFEITLGPAAVAPITVEYRTVDGTARAGSDYSARSGSVRFDPGQSKKTVAVNVIGDALAEPNETFFLDVTRVLGGQIQDGRGQATILNDDAGSPPPPGTPAPVPPPPCPDCQQP